jgi:hypothetical protein
MNSRRMRRVGIVAYMRKVRNICEILVSKPEGELILHWDGSNRNSMRGCGLN